LRAFLKPTADSPYIAGRDNRRSGETDDCPACWRVEQRRKKAQPSLPPSSARYTFFLIGTPLRRALERGAHLAPRIEWLAVKISE
jgi:hypothetical protein